MCTKPDHRLRAWRLLAGLTAALLVSAVVVPSALAEQGVYVVGVEEEWELVVGEVDPDRDAPQVTVVISPVGNLDGVYAAFELNHQSQPDYVGGGLQLQVWGSNEQPLATRQQKDGQNLVHANETVTWTQKMQVQDGQLTFQVTNGSSTSWGAFGDSLTASVPTTLSNLNAYNPMVSVNGSGVGFASNRVTSLKLKKVRVRLSTGHVLVDDTVKVAFPKS